MLAHAATASRVTTRCLHRLPLFLDHKRLVIFAFKRQHVMPSCVRMKHPVLRLKSLGWSPSDARTEETAHAVRTIIRRATRTRRQLENISGKSAAQRIA